MKYQFIGWCKEDISDKVWGVIELEAPHINAASIFELGVYMIFWGRRGNKLQTKIITDSDFSINDKIYNKCTRGYTEVDITKLNEVYPQFEEELNKKSIWARLSI